MRASCIPFLLLTVLAHAQQTSVLFLGNSYTGVNDLPATFRQLALSLGDTVVTDANTPGGYQLGNHSGDATSVAAIASQPWDFVVMQEQSQLGALPFENSGFEAGAAALVQLIEANDECTYPVFYMTWGRKNGDAGNCPWFPMMCTYDSMQQALRDNYLAIAQQNDGYAAPVGWAWKHVRDAYPNIELYQSDESHPSVEGTYLAACTFYCTLFRQSCVGASFTSSVQPATAAILQSIASATVLDSVDTWNLNVANGTDATIATMSSDIWNQITFHHPGQGSHWWVCSTGDSSTDQEPTFTVPGPGVYTFTHVYIDPCGNMDTYTWTVEFYETGIHDISSSGSAQLRTSGPGTVEVTTTGPGTLRMVDLQGRITTDRALAPGSTHIVCSPGLQVWRIEESDGTISRGKVFVP